MAMDGDDGGREDRAEEDPFRNFNIGGGAFENICSVC